MPPTTVAASSSILLLLLIGENNEAEEVIGYGSLSRPPNELRYNIEKYVRVIRERQQKKIEISIIMNAYYKTIRHYNKKYTI